MTLNYAESIIWAFIIVLTIIVLMLIIYLKILRRDIRVRDRKIIKYREFVEKNLVAFLYAEGPDKVFSVSQKEILKEFKKGINSKRKRRIMISTFLKLEQEISGNMNETLYKLFDKVGLIKYALRKLRSKKWNVVALAIKDLRNFRVSKVQLAIKGLINHPREEIRREAHMYFVELFGYEGLRFLDDLERPLSEWDQILLLGIIEENGKNNINHKDLTKWLNSKNDYVVLFILNIVKALNRLETKELLLELLNHENEEVRLKVISVLTHFEVHEAKSILTNKIHILSLKETQFFFEYLTKVATQEDVPFVLSYTNNPNFDIKLKALQILQKVDYEQYNNLEKESENDDYNRIVEYLDASYGI